MSSSWGDEPDSFFKNRFILEETKTEGVWWTSSGRFTAGLGGEGHRVGGRISTVEQNQNVGRQRCRERAGVGGRRGGGGGIGSTAAPRKRNSSVKIEFSLPFSTSIPLFIFVVMGER